MPRHGRHRRCGEGGAGPEPGGRRARRRSQRGGAFDHRGRPDDRPVAHDRHPRRSEGAHRPGAGRPHLEPVQPGDPASRAGDDRRRGLHDRRRRADARRRPRLADGQARIGARQPAVRRSRSGGRQNRHGERRRQRRPVLGAARRRRQFRRGGIVRIPPASGRPDGHRRGHRLPVQRGMGRAAVLSGTSPRRCRTSSWCSAA